jgi:hypothetical protein
LNLSRALPLIAACVCHSTGCFADGESWRLTTDDTVVVVKVQDAMPVITQVGLAKTDSNWLLRPVPEILLPSVEQNGKAPPTAWQFQGGSFDSQAGELVLKFSNAAPAMEMKSIWRARPGHGPVEHWLTIENRTVSVITLGHQDSLVLGHLAIPRDESMDAWSINRGAANATKEGGTLVQSIGWNTNETLVSDVFNASSPVPWLALQVGTERGLYVGWEFSGIGRIHLHNLHGSSDSAGAKTAELGIEVGNVPEFKTDLPAGETFVVPAAFVGCYSGDIDDGSYTLHRFVVEKLVPRIPPGYVHPTLAYNLYMDGGGFDAANEASVLRSAALAKELGFETFVVDAMWFPQSGDWRWDPKRFPHGVRPIEEYVHSNGMKFGLWMAYTHGSDATDPNALNVTEHADWFFQPPVLDPEGSHINWTALVDLGDDPARDWVESATQQAVSEYKVDYFKTDSTPIVTRCDKNDHRHHYGVDVSYWSTLGYYAVQENLLKKFPDLICEGCSGAGHIKDFGDIQRVHMIALTDRLSALPDRQGIYDSTFAFPPSVLISYTYPNWYAAVSDAPEPYFWRSSMMSQWQIDPNDSANWSPEQLRKIRRATDVYKSWIRPILQDVEVHHILPRPDGFHWDGMFYWSPSLRRGTLYIFRPNSDQKSQTIPLKGLLASSRYKVSTEDHSTAEAVYTGEALMDTGLPIRLPAKYTSDLIYVEEIR